MSPRTRTVRKDRYTVVQHSGYGYAEDATFLEGLESRPLETDAQIARINRIGGAVFDSYGEAEDFCDWAMYIAHATPGIVPEALKIGEFDRLQVDGLAIFKPKKNAVESFRADPGGVFAS
jgi:hypothetical protein